MISPLAHQDMYLAMESAKALARGLLKIESSFLLGVLFVGG